jgi:hypothetical protein
LEEGELQLRQHAYRPAGGRAAILALALAGFLAGCNATGNQVENTLDPLSAQQTPGDGLSAAIDPVQDLRAYCPKAVLRAGTEAYDIYPPKMKKDDPDREKKLRFRITVTDLVRECNSAGQFLRIKVGIAGRAVSGPARETGTFTVPIRIAITQGDSVLYSQLHDVPVEIPPGRPNNTFSYVDDAIAIPKPDKENVIIYVGVDELRVDVPGAVPADGVKRPVN